jgi:hypothetical protein
MQISLRSQMIAGTTAFVGATAIAMTPVAPAISIPSISVSKAAVSLAAFNNPLSALINTAVVLGNYTLNGAYTTPGVNWPGSGTYAYPDGIGALVNAGIPSQGVVTPGLLPNILATPLPIATTFLTNQLGYAYIALGSAAIAAGDLTDILWAIPATALAVILNPAAAIATIQAAIAGAIASAQDAVGALITGATTIVNSIVTKGQAVANFLLEEASLLPTILGGQFQILAGSVTGLAASVTAALATANPLQNGWNALVDGLLDATVSGSIPATVINLTYGAGVQFAPVTGLPAPFVPSVRTTGTALITGVADALNTPVPAPTASVSAASVRAEAAPAAAVAAEAAPAAEATAGDNSAAAEESTTAAPAASAAADDSTSSDAPKASKAGAARAGR